MEIFFFHILIKTGLLCRYLYLLNTFSLNLHLHTYLFLFLKMAFLGKTSGPSWWVFMKIIEYHARHLDEWYTGPRLMVKSNFLGSFKLQVELQQNIVTLTAGSPTPQPVTPSIYGQRYQIISLKCFNFCSVLLVSGYETNSRKLILSAEKIDFYFIVHLSLNIFSKTLHIIYLRY